MKGGKKQTEEHNEGHEVSEEEEEQQQVEAQDQETEENVEAEGGDDNEEEGEGGEAEGDNEEAAGDEEGEAGEGEGATKPKKQLPAIKLGSKEFATPKDIGTHLSKLLQASPLDEQLPEEEARVLMDLLEQYHPKAKEKAAPGLTGVVVRLHPEHMSKCFFMIKKDGSEEDFSFRKCIENVGGLGRRVVKFEGLEPGTPFQNVKDAFTPFGKCFVSMNNGETHGFVKYAESLFGKKLINYVKKEPLKIGDSIVNVRYLTEEEEKVFWEDQKEATKKAEQKRLNYEKKKGSFQKKGFDKGKGGKPFNKRERGDQEKGEGQKRQKTEQQEAPAVAAAEATPEKKGTKINVPQGGKRR